MSERQESSAASRYEFWGESAPGAIPLWARLIGLPLMIVGFWGVSLLGLAWNLDHPVSYLRESAVVWWRMMRYGDGQR